MIRDGICRNWYLIDIHSVRHKIIVDCGHTVCYNNLIKLSTKDGKIEKARGLSLSFFYAIIVYDLYRRAELKWFNAEYEYRLVQPYKRNDIRKPSDEEQKTVLKGEKSLLLKLFFVIMVTCKSVRYNVGNRQKCNRYICIQLHHCEQISDRRHNQLIFKTIKKIVFLGITAVVLCTGCSMNAGKAKESERQSSYLSESDASEMIDAAAVTDKKEKVVKKAADAETVPQSEHETETFSQLAEENTSGIIVETIFETEENTADHVIIVLDPGHDSEYCTRNHPDLGFNEQDLNLTIGLACRERLQAYDGVTVYMTREDGTCPDPESYGEFCIEKRTGFGTEMGADLFVSLHCNATTGVLGDGANGAEVYVSSYPAYTESSTRLGEMILEELEGVGLRSNGVILRQKEEKGTYDDGTVQDWYYLISESVEGGHPGIIIEHGYMDNTYDNALFRDEQKLIAMGIADADAIAAYYGLTLK